MRGTVARRGRVAHVVSSTAKHSHASQGRRHTRITPTYRETGCEHRHRHLLPTALIHQRADDDVGIGVNVVMDDTSRGVHLPRHVITIVVMAHHGEQYSNYARRHDSGAQSTACTGQFSLPRYSHLFPCQRKSTSWMERRARVAASSIAQERGTRKQNLLYTHPKHARTHIFSTRTATACDTGGEYLLCGEQSPHRISRQWNSDTEQEQQSVGCASPGTPLTDRDRTPTKPSTLETLPCTHLKLATCSSHILEGHKSTAQDRHGLSDTHDPPPFEAAGFTSASDMSSPPTMLKMTPRASSIGKSRSGEHNAPTAASSALVCKDVIHSGGRPKGQG